MINIIREFNYSSLSQRRFVQANVFLSFLVTGLLVGIYAINLKYYFIYQPVVEIIILICFGGIFAGALIGYLLFSLVRKSRIIYIIGELLFITLTAGLLLLNLMLQTEKINISTLLALPVFIYPLLCFLMTFFLGYKVCYFMKISCGKFIDERKSAPEMFTLSLLGMALSVFAVLFFAEKMSVVLSYGSFIPLILIVPLMFLIKLEFSPQLLYAREFVEEHEESDVAESERKDDLFFNYCNYAYYIIYIYLGYFALLKYYRDSLELSFIFFLVVALSISVGSLISRFIKKAFWNIYTELFYPVFFLGFLISLYMLGNRIGLVYGIMLFIPTLVLFGFSLRHTINNIIYDYDSEKSFKIMLFSVFVIPFPILLALSYIYFSNVWYYLLLYVIMLINLIFPGIHLLQRKVQGYKKVIYLVFSLVLIPLPIFLHGYFKQSFNTKSYQQYTQGFDDIWRINYNTEYLPATAEVTLNNIPIFKANDGVIRTLKSELIPLYFFAKIDEAALYLDGNQRFFRNPIPANFKNLDVLNYVPGKSIDFNNLPITGSQKYATIDRELLTYVNKKKGFYSLIIDQPNLYDQKINSFRFSKEYFQVIKKSLKKDGIYALTINADRINPALYEKGIESIKEKFSQFIVFRFSDDYLIICSNSADPLKFNPEGISAWQDYARREGFYSSVVYNDSIVWGSYIGKNPDVLPQVKNVGKKVSIINPNNLSDLIDYTSADVIYLKEYNTINSFDSFNQLSWDIRGDILNQLSRNNDLLTNFKVSQLAERRGDYLKETQALAELTKLGAYRDDLKIFMKKLVDYKVANYFNYALNGEKVKDWDRARNLYEAILVLEPDNFEANYRLGTLFISLQELGSAFEHLDKAMKLQKEDPKVMFQMGVILFLSEKPSEALNYLQKALEMKENSSLIYLYIGLCYEAMKQNSQALDYYKRAEILDPNDIRVKTALERINKKLSDVKQTEEDSSFYSDIIKQQRMEVEESETIQLPVNSRAEEGRLKDDEVPGPIQ